MQDHVYKIVELAGSSETSIDDAILSAISRARSGWGDPGVTTGGLRRARRRLQGWSEGPCAPHDRASVKPGLCP